MKKLEAPILERLFDPIGKMLTPEAARKLVNYHLNAKDQTRLDKFARKCSEGKLSDEERREYEACVETMDFIAILQAKARALLKQSNDA